jgi:xanthine/CO dehydrogenase XdhC/CoxF family maturation factor
MLSKPADALSQLKIDSRMVFLLMTHNYNYDFTLLTELINTPTPYIGVLGPRKKTSRMLSELNEQGIGLTTSQQNKIFGPMGLDTGGENAEESALSVCAEINAVLNARKGGNLRERDGSIHAQSFIRAE